ncbi:MAG: hypothetical protein GKR89_32340 [Candidatus Latescibacteria bacterium]|nr:hypothetical protein [Candidatus Latescibacterota bacterium]
MRRFLLLFLGLLFLANPQPSLGQTPAKAFWRSLLIPGWGQYYAGQGSGARFLMAEVALWSGFFGLRQLANGRRDHYRTYAAEHAQARPQGKDGQFFDDLGFYQNRLQHDQYARYDDGPAAAVYPATPEFFWEWDSETSRQRYRDLRNGSETAKQQAVFATGAIVAHHLIAAIHAARKAGEEDLQETQLGLGAIDRSWALVWRRSF